MDRIRFAVLALLLAAFAAPVWPQDTGTIKKIRELNEIVLGVRDSSVPFSYFDGNGQAIGYSVDLCMHVVERLKREFKMPTLKARLQPVTSATRIPLIQNGTVDLECGSTVNNLERHKQVDFSLTTFVVNTKFIAKKTSNIKTTADLKGKAVAVTSGTNTMQKAGVLNKQQNLDVTVLNGKDHAESFLLVTSDRAVAFAEDDILLAGLAGTSRTPDAFALVAIDGMLGDPYALMLRRDDPQFKAAVDAGLRELFGSGELKRIYDTWFVRPIPPRNVVLNFPMTEQLQRVIAKPTDSPEPQDYK